MRQKQVNCPTCGVLSLFQAQDELTAGERFFVAFGAVMLTVLTCGLGLPIAILGYIGWIYKQNKDRSVYRCMKCGAAEQKVVDATARTR